MKKKSYAKLFSIIFLFTLRTTAQEFPVLPVEKNTYERLLKAQEEFRAAVASGDSLQIGETAYVAGKRYAELNDSQKGRYFLFRALRIFEHLRLSEKLGKVYMRLGEWSLHRNELSQAFTYIHQARFHFISSNQVDRFPDVNRVLADIHTAGWYDHSVQPRSLFSLDSSFYYYHKAIQTARRYHRIEALAHSYQFLAGAYERQKDFINTIKYSKEAFKWYRKENFINYSAEAGTRIGIAYIQLREPAKAKEWLKRVETMAAATPGVRAAQLSIAKQWLGILYQQAGDWKQTAVYQQQQYELLIKDIQYYRNSVNEGARLLYESEQKEMKLLDEKKGLELALLLENKRQQTWLNIFIAFLLIGAAIAGVVYYRLFRKYKETSRQNAELVKEQSHRIKNNLQSIYDLLTLQLYDLSDPKAIEALEESLTRINAMSLIHRRLYDGNQPDEVELAGYIPDLVKSALRSYHLDLAEVTYQLDPIWLHADKAIPLALIINELTTNACKYAFNDNPAPRLDIACHSSGQEIVLTFKDNGPGFATLTEASAFGLGLIDLLVKKLHGKSSFNTEAGCMFTLSFMVHTKTAVRKSQVTT